MESLAPWKGVGGFGLDKIRVLCRALGDPQDSVKTIHVVGTNGKGSVSASICAILGAAGCRVGLNISPHLQYMRERIVVDGLSISDDELDRFAATVMQAARSVDIEPSFFEAITATAFVAFREMKVEWAVIEAGLGARYDATNVIAAPRAVVLVSVQHDHEDILGHWPDSIATEKSQAIKSGAIVMLGDLDTISSSIARERALQCGCPVFQVGQEVSLSPVDGCRWALSVAGRQVKFSPGLAGLHQVHNVGLAVGTALALGIREEACISGARDVFWPARLESIAVDGRQFILDCAHNMEGIQSVVAYLKQRGISDVSLVFSALSTKNWKAMAKDLVPYVRRWLVLQARGPRAASCNDIKDYLEREFAAEVRSFGDNYGAALDAFMKSGDEMCLICGSMYMVGPIRQLLNIEERRIWHLTN
ncbi:MAG: hypothetical protein K1X79_02335 [Oligoflexia bacterium]|nr:hypothetical protein [Oligoflexia bacterium]